MKTIFKELYIRKMSKAINTINSKSSLTSTKVSQFQKTKRELIKLYCH